LLFYKINLKEKNKIKLLSCNIYLYGDWGLGIGDWGLGIGDWAQSPIPNPNPQSPIPNPQSPFYYLDFKIIIIINKFMKI